MSPGDAYLIAPGHDAWTVGDEPCVVVEFQSAATFGKPSVQISVPGYMTDMSSRLASSGLSSSRRK